MTNPESFNKLLTYFHTIWLKASPQEHMDRVRAQGDERPMRGNPEAMAQLNSLLKSRESLYARAQLHLNTSGMAQGKSLEDLLSLITENKLLQD